MTDALDYKPLITMAIFFIGIFILEGLLYGEELLEVTNDQIGIANVPIPPEDAWNILGWFGFFFALVGFVTVLLINCLTLPIDDIPLVARIIILTPMWIMTVVLLYNFFTKLIHSIGNIIPFTIVLIGSIKNDK